MNTPTRRYVFLDFENLKAIKFKKLEKVCDKLFVFVNETTENIPFSLVKEMQSMGSNVKWIGVNSPTQQDLHFHICFVMGKLHEKISADIEFAILSNDAAFDPLVTFINSTGRNCLRVKQQAEPIFESPKPTAKPIATPAMEVVINANYAAEEEKPKMSLAEAIAADMQLQQPQQMQEVQQAQQQSEVVTDRATADASLIDQTARETVRRLIRSGNRPAEIANLKNYILLHNQELSVHGNIDRIINRMAELNEIHILNNEVLYNF